MTMPSLMYGRKYQKGLNTITVIAMTAFHIGAVAAFFVIDGGAIVAAIALWLISGSLGIGSRRPAPARLGRTRHAAWPIRGAVCGRRLPRDRGGWPGSRRVPRDADRHDRAYGSGAPDRA